jgi:hypothetical protein
VKNSDLRGKLFAAMSAIVEHCGTPGMSPSLLRAEFDQQIRLFVEDFKDVPEAAVFVEYIQQHYARRPG